MVQLALFLWPVAAVIIFASLPVASALISAMLFGYLILPERYEIDLPLLPAYDKDTAVLLGVFLGLAMFGRPTRNLRDPASNPKSDRISKDRRIRYVVWICVAFLVLGTFVTWRTNMAPIFHGPVVLQGISFYDALSIVMNTGVMLLPFYLGWRYLAAPDTHLTLLKIVFAAGVCYCGLALVEVRLSPQLHTWVYGYFQHSFLQHVRGGYRPILFLAHGLEVGIFLLAAVFAGIGLLKRSMRGHAGIWIAIVIMVVTFGLSRNLGAALLFFVLAPAIFFFPLRAQLWTMTFVALFFLSYPVLWQVVPKDWVVTQVSRLSEDRAQSLQFRVDNETELLARAQEKPIAGWGGYNRNAIFTERGRRTSIVDGGWIILMGSKGWLGFVGQFGLLAGALFFMISASRRKEIPPETIMLGFIVAANILYLIPNSFLSPLVWMIAGALTGFVQFDVAKQATDDSDPVVDTASRYTRFAPKTDPAT